jgi:hypothetical protein
MPKKRAIPPSPITDAVADPPADRWAAYLPPVTVVYDPAREMTVKDFQKRTNWGYHRATAWLDAEVAAGRWVALEVLDGKHPARAWRPVKP